MPICQDHKRLLVDDRGPNTGGMGVVCPFPLPQCLIDSIRADILEKAITGLRNDGKVFKGVLYAGIILTNDGPKVLEFNCRFGDPETQVHTYTIC